MNVAGELTIIAICMVALISAILALMIVCVIVCIWIADLISKAFP